MELTRRFSAGIMALAATVTGCTADADHAGSGEPGLEVPPSAVDVRIENAMLRPWDPEGELWDDSQKVSADDVEALAALFTQTEPYAAVAGLVADLALDHWAPPDPYGEAAVHVDGAWSEPLVLATPDDNEDNTLTPVWGEGWDDLSLDEELRIDLRLTDEDDFLSGSDDPIGTVRIDHDAIVEAWRDGGVFQVPVHEQGLGTILFVGITAAASSRE